MMVISDLVDHCFPKDLSLIHVSEDLITTSNVLRSDRDTNDEVRRNRVEKMKGRTLSESNFYLWHVKK